jgi:hypothetical protein
MNHRIHRPPNTDLSGRRVLTMLAAGNRDEMRYVVGPLAAAKAHWCWHIDILCRASDREAYRELAGPSGKIFAQPKLLEVKPWEADPAAVSNLDLQLWDAETAAHIPAGQIILSGSATIGRAFVASVRHLNETPVGRRVLRDNEEPFRIVRRLFKFAEELLDASAPDFVFAYEWAKPWRFAIWLAATRRGIPCVAVRRSKIRSDHCFLTVDPLMLNAAAIQKAQAKRNSNVPISDAAISYIRRFREQPEMVQHVQNKWRFSSRQKKDWFLRHARFVMGLPRQLAKAIGKRKGEGPKSTFKLLVGYDRRLFLAWRHRRVFRRFDASELKDLRYVYFALHKETDDSLVFQTPAWSDQRNTVGLLASVLPSRHRLLVRENRLNYGRRPTRYYRELSRLPGVILIDPFDSQFEYLRNADLIVTENGSCGWEGLLFQRRVITLTRNFYDGAGLARRVKDINELRQTILELLSNQSNTDAAAHDHALGCMIDAELETTLPMNFEQSSQALDLFEALISPLIVGAQPSMQPLGRARAY